MKYSIEIQNLKCGGCANTITKELTKLQGVSDVQVDENTSLVDFDLTDENKMEEVHNKLSTLGYPVVGDDNSGLKKAKSYVSCMIGRVS